MAFAVSENPWLIFENAAILLTSLSIFTLNINSFFENIKYYQPLFEQH